MGTVRPLLVQDGTRDPAYAEMPAVRAGLTRYLGVPIFTPTGEPTGTLCSTTPPTNPWVKRTCSSSRS